VSAVTAKTPTSARRVLFVSSSYPFSRDDFHARFVHDMARAFVRRGARVRVLTPATPGGAPSERWQGVEVERFDYPGLARFPSTGGEGLLQNVKRDRRAALSLGPLFARMATRSRQRIAQLRPDLVVTHWLVPAGLAVARAGAARVVHVAHSSDVHLLGRAPFGRQIARAVRASGPVLATSDWLAQRMRERGLVDDAIPWSLGVDPLPARDDAPRDGPLRVAFMGRLIDGKGLPALVRAVADGDARLSIAGDGPLRRTLEDEVHARGLQHRVRFVGAVTGEAKARFLREHDVFAHVPEPKADFVDNLPVSCLEALAAGTPVLATPVGALPELLSTGAGLVVRPQDVDGVLSGLQREDLQRMVPAARRVAAQRSWSRAVDALERAAG
jgi:glycosyltransferase involved in cell wall biosynthesis